MTVKVIYRQLLKYFWSSSAALFGAHVWGASVTRAQQGRAFFSRSSYGKLQKCDPSCLASLWVFFLLSVDHSSSKL